MAHLFTVCLVFMSLAVIRVSFVFKAQQGIVNKGRENRTGIESLPQSSHCRTTFTKILNLNMSPFPRLPSLLSFCLSVSLSLCLSLFLCLSLSLSLCLSVSLSLSLSISGSRGAAANAHQLSGPKHKQQGSSAKEAKDVVESSRPAETNYVV